MQIKTSFVYPPIPDRRFDWSAIDDDTYDGEGCHVGYGATEREAVLDLLLWIESDLDESDARNDEIARLRAQWTEHPCAPAPSTHGPAGADAANPRQPPSAPANFGAK